MLESKVKTHYPRPIRSGSFKQIDVQRERNHCIESRAKSAIHASANTRLDALPSMRHNHSFAYLAFKESSTYIEG